MELVKDFKIIFHPLKYCYVGLPSFSEISDKTFKMYERANQIEDLDRLPISSQRPSSRMHQSGGSNQLYFVEKSNYCKETIGRECNPKSDGSDSCNKLCCGRGYKKQTKTTTESIWETCRFEWCCSIKCDTRKVTTEIFTCK